MSEVSSNCDLLSSKLVVQPFRTQEFVRGIISRCWQGLGGGPAKCDCLSKVVLDWILPPIAKCQNEAVCRESQFGNISVGSRESEVNRYELRLVHVADGDLGERLLRWVEAMSS